MKVSIIVPVYNTEDFLEECIKSAQNQTLDDIEILIINDGSTDNSLNICREFEKNDKRIRVFTQENSGVSAARNKGIDKAKGEYVYFLDSDDYILPKFIEISYNIAHANNSDMVICSKYRNKYIENDLKRISNEGTSSIFVKNNFLKMHPDIRYTVGIITAEDNLFFTKIMTFAKNVSINYEDFYFYRQHDKQNTRTLFCDPEVVHTQIPKILKNLEEFFDKHNLWEKEYARFANFLHVIVHSWLHIKHLKNYKVKQDTYKQIKNLYKNKIEKYMTDEDKKYLRYRFLLLINSKNVLLYELRLKLSNNKIFHLLYIIKKLLKKAFFAMVYNLKIKFKILHRDEKKFIKDFLENINPDRTLIVEANDFHHETLPGYIDYFNKLGIKCDVLLTHKSKEKDVFFNNTLVKNIYYARKNVIWELLKKPEIKKYKYVFVTSNYIGLLKKTATNIKNLSAANVIIAEHNTKYLTSKILKKYNISCINAMGKNYLKNNVINPHYFTDNAPHQKNNITKFLIVGRIQNSRYNYEAVYDAITKLKARNIFDYKIIIAGSEIEKVDCYLANEVNLDYLGPLDFQTLYNEVQKADFLLTLFDPDIKCHNRYLYEATSGQIQLSYGFLKPSVTHRTFAKNFGFNETNSLIIDNCKDLDKTIISAIGMKNNEYQDLCKNLKILKNNIYNDSLNNLKNILNI